MSNFRLSRLLPRFLRGDKDKNAGFTKDAGDKNCCRILFLDDTELKLPLKVSHSENRHAINLLNKIPH